MFSHLRRIVSSFFGLRRFPVCRGLAIEDITEIGMDPGADLKRVLVAANFKRMVCNRPSVLLLSDNDRVGRAITH